MCFAYRVDENRVYYKEKFKEGRLQRALIFIAMISPGTTMAPKENYYEAADLISDSKDATSEYEAVQPIRKPSVFTPCPCLR